MRRSGRTPFQPRFPFSTRGLRWAGGLLLAAWLAGRPALVYAHPGEPVQPHDLWSAWPLSLWPITALVLTAWLYARGHRAWRAQGRVLGWRSGAFAAGWLALAVALVTPLDSLGHALFSAHMAQHLLLILVAAPLLVVSAPLGPLLLGLPAPYPAALGAWWRRSDMVRRAWDLVSAPAAAWVTHSLALWVWHAPGYYEAALTHEGLHALEHASFFGTALLFWWALFHPSRRSAWMVGPGGALYVFTMALQSGLLGALITLTREPWYPIYAGTTAAWGLTPLEDQQVAGAIMWIPSGLVYLGAALVVFGLWFAAMERRTQPDPVARLTKPAPDSS